MTNSFNDDDINQFFFQINDALRAHDRLVPDTREYAFPKARINLAFNSLSLLRSIYLPNISTPRQDPSPEEVTIEKLPTEYDPPNSHIRNAIAKARWSYDAPSEVLLGQEVEILGIDRTCGTPARFSCWIRWKDHDSGSMHYATCSWDSLTIIVDQPKTSFILRVMKILMRFYR